MILLDPTRSPGANLLFIVQSQDSDAADASEDHSDAEIEGLEEQDHGAPSRGGHQGSASRSARSSSGHYVASMAGTVRYEPVTVRQGTSKTSTTRSSSRSRSTRTAAPRVRSASHRSHGSAAPPDVKRRRVPEEVATDAAREKIDKCRSTMDWKQHWESKKRKSHVDAEVRAIETCGRKCGTFLGSESSQSLAATCFEEAARIELRQSVFEQIRHNFALFCTSASPEEAKSFGAGPPELLGRIFTMEFQKMIDRVHTDPKLLEVLINGMEVRPQSDEIDITGDGEPKTMQLIGFKMIKREVPLVVSGQEKLAAALAERVWKYTGQSTIIAVCRQLCELMPWLPSCLDGINVNSKVLGSKGWCTQAVCDLTTLVFGGLLLESIKSPSVFNRNIRLSCVTFIRNREKISPRQRIYFKGIHGARTNWGKQVWDQMEIHAQSCNTSGAAPASVDAKGQTSKDDKADATLILQTILDCLGKEVERADPQFITVFNIMVGLLEEDPTASTLYNIGMKYANDEDEAWPQDGRDGDGHEDLAKLCQKFVTYLLKALDMQMTQDDSNNSFWLYFSRFCLEVPVTPSEPISGKGEQKDKENEGEAKEKENEAAGEDEETDIPAQMFSLFHSVLILLSHYSSKADELIQAGVSICDVYQRAEMNARVDRQSPDAEKEIIRVFNQLSEMYLELQNIELPEKPVFETSESGYTVTATLQYIVKEELLAKHFVNEIRFFMGQGGPNLQLLHEYDKKAAILPQELANVITAGRTLNQLRDVCSKNRAGKYTGGLTELLQILDKVTQSQVEEPYIFAKRGESFSSDYKAALSAWRKCCECSLEKVLHINSVLQKFEAKYKNADVAIRTWCFTDTPYMRTSSQSQSDKQFAKTVLNTTTQFKVWRQVLERSFSVMREDWATPELYARFQEVGESKRDYAPRRRGVGWGGRRGWTTMTSVFVVMALPSHSPPFPHTPLSARQEGGRH